MKLREWLVLGLATTGLIFASPVQAQAQEIEIQKYEKEESREGYIGVGLSNRLDDDVNPRVDAEVMLPLTDWAELRATTDFSNRVDVLPTVSVGLGDTADLYAGAGLNYEDDCYHLLVRSGFDWNLTDNLVGLTYFDYANDRVDFTAGLGYRFGSLDSGSNRAVSDRVEVAPIDRN